MKNNTSLTALTIAGLALFVTGCDIDKTEDGEMPSVDLDVDAGSLPEYDVEMADVDAGTTTETVMVPKVVMVEEEVEVPYIDIDMPDDDAEIVEKTITASARVKGSNGKLDISEIYRGDDELFVVSTLEAGSGSGDATMVKDAVMTKVPDVDIEHIILGDRPEGELMDGYTYVANSEELADEIDDDAKRIWSKSKKN